MYSKNIDPYKIKRTGKSIVEVDICCSFLTTHLPIWRFSFLLQILQKFYSQI